MATKGLYKIENNINGKVYIGESVNIEQRWSVHLEDLKANKHHSYKLQKDWNEFGEDKFSFEVLIKIEDYKSVMIIKTLCLIKEEEYIIKYDSIINGYNIKPNNYDEALRKRECGVVLKYLNIYKNKSELGHYVEIDGFLVEKIYSLSDVAKSVGIGYYKLGDILCKDGYLISLDKQVELRIDDVFLVGKNTTRLKLNKEIYDKLVNKYKIP